MNTPLKSIALSLALLGAAFAAIPAARADVFPAALITMLTVAEYGLIRLFHHSLYNLRWGVAAEALGNAGMHP